MATLPHSRRDFKIAVICALPLEAESVQCVFDRCWDDENHRFNKAAGDQNTYTTGVIGIHNVVLVHMSGMGSIGAALAAAGLRFSYPNIKLVLVVGICGVVPVHPETKQEIVLGDIVVSTAVTQYDFGRQYPQGFSRKTGVDDSLGRASPSLRAFINKLQTPRGHQRLSEGLKQLVLSNQFQSSALTLTYPGVAQDWLYEASHLHQHRPQVSCDTCHDNLETCSKSCDVLGCGQEQLISRKRHHHHDLLNSEDVQMNIPFIHFGRVGSANTVMKSAVDRDRIATADSIAAFEMEGAGVWDQHPTVVIKAACDYADSHKNKHWQGYAAAMAAACLKVFLVEWAVEDDEVDKRIPIHHLPLDHIEGFIGRTEELKRVKEVISSTRQRRLVSILGLGGVGKSRMALELAYQTRSEHPECSVFWVQAADLSTYERDILEIGKKLNIPGITGENADAKLLVREHLSKSAEDKWILILDNADDEMLWGHVSDPAQTSTSLVSSLPKTDGGSIVVTTRTRRIATFLAGKNVVDLSEMPPDQAVEMLMDGLETPTLAVDQTTSLALVEKLTCLPLAIVQAASFLNRSQETASTYLRLLDQAEDGIIELLSKDFEEPSGYQRKLHPVATTWLVSFQQIRDRHPLAAEYLTGMACLHEKSIPLSLLPPHSPNDIVDAIAVLVGYSFVKRQQAQLNTDMPEVLYDMHRLVHLCTRNWLKKEGQLADKVASCGTRVLEVFPPADVWNRALWTMYLPHSRRLCADEYFKQLPESYHLLTSMAHCLHKDAKYDEALDILTTVAEKKEENLGKTDPVTIMSIYHIGELYNSMGHWSTAEEYLQKAFDLAMAKTGPESFVTSKCMQGLSIAYSGQERFDEAQRLQVQVFELRKKTLGEEHRETLFSMNNVAIELWSSKDPVEQNEGEGLFLKLVEMSKRVHGVEHPDTLRFMHNLAFMYGEKWRLAEAEEIYIDLLETKKKVCGPEDPETLITINNLGATYLHQKRWLDAKALGLQAFEVTQRVLGMRNLTTLLSMQILADALKHLGNSHEATQLMESCLALSMDFVGPKHPHTRRAMATLEKWQAAPEMPGAWVE